LSRARPHGAGVPGYVHPDNGPDALPWVTFGPWTSVAGELFISVLILDPPKDRDYAGRLIFAQRIFLIRYSELAAAGALYRQLWDAVRDVSLPAPDRQPLQLQLQPEPIDELAATVERYGQERMTTLAALILEGKVALAGSAALPRDERLAVLDAAMALLPYGFRAFLGASTAANNTSYHGLDLVFAEYAQSDHQILVPLSGTVSIPVPRTRIGRDYLDLLREKIKRIGIQDVIAHLRTATKPYALDQPDPALEVLRELPSETAQEEAERRAAQFSRLTLDAFAELVEPGRLMFNPPNHMQMGLTERVEVRLTRGLDLDAELLKHLRGRGEPQLEEIQTTSLMAITLKSDGFQITAYSDEEQVLTRNDVTTWEFDIQAIKSGPQRLVLCASLRIPVAGQTFKQKSIPVREFTIDVEARRPVLIVHFVSANWQWFIGTAIAIATVIVAILYH